MEHFENNGVKPSDRRIVLKMHSLVYNQFQAPVFKPMLKYAWIKSGYTQFDEEESYEFLNVKQLLFNEIGTCSECEEVSFIKCAHCGILLCFSHFLHSFHYHNI